MSDCTQSRTRQKVVMLEGIKGMWVFEGERAGWTRSKLMPVFSVVAIAWQNFPRAIQVQARRKSNHLYSKFVISDVSESSLYKLDKLPGRHAQQ
jgi:hypothetical protein